MFQFLSCIPFLVLWWQLLYGITGNIFVISFNYLARILFCILGVVDVVTYRYVQRTLMTLWAWIKSMIKVDMFCGHKRNKRQFKNCLHHCPRYYIRHVKHNSSRVRWRRSQNRLHLYFTFASLSKTTKI
jgi:hypothetical protein